MTDRQKPVILCIMDGWGHAPASKTNAVSMAHTPHVDTLMRSGPRCFLTASGEGVGLPEGQPGNSEVGHLTIGSGRLIQQDLPRIDQAISDGKLANLPQMQQFIADMKASRGAVHMLGLLSSGGVHAHSRHIRACANLFAAAGLPVHIHMFSDGRDCPPKSADKMLAAFRSGLDASITISTLTGRYFAMDRDNRWERTIRARDVILLGSADYQADNAESAIKDAYDRGEMDEFISPTRIGDYKGMNDGDGLFMANFRVDRARQIMSAFLTPETTDLPPAKLPEFAACLSMTPLSDWLEPHVAHLFGQSDMSGGLGQTVAEAGLKQLRLAETEKYPHVTFFFNGGVEIPFASEERIVIASAKVATYDQQPEMRAAEILREAERAIKEGKTDLIIINFANPDMVGHTGDLSAAITAIETVDLAVGQLIEAVLAAHGVMIITADHGNCEVMWDAQNDCPHTAHTTNLVPCMLVGAKTGAKLNNGSLVDLAPTLLYLLNLPIPPLMTGKCLIPMG